MKCEFCFSNRGLTAERIGYDDDDPQEEDEAQSSQNSSGEALRHRMPATDAAAMRMAMMKERAYIRVMLRMSGRLALPF